MPWQSVRRSRVVRRAVVMQNTAIECCPSFFFSSCGATLLDFLLFHNKTLLRTQVSSTRLCSRLNYDTEAYTATIREAYATCRFFKDRALTSPTLVIDNKGSKGWFPHSHSVATNCATRFLSPFLKPVISSRQRKCGNQP